MTEFEYYLFENFDPDEELNNPSNPRNFLGKGTDGLLSEIARYPAGHCSFSACCDAYDTQLIRKLLDGGVLRADGDALVFCCPIFFQADGAVLNQEVAKRAKRIAKLLSTHVDELYAKCEKLNNGFSVQRNLYHILCGMVFDGFFFDYLSDHGALITSKCHRSGLDYLSVIYEKCDLLENLSNGLLCSYNRLVNERCALQSFGDVQGDRFDFYRLFRLMEHGNIPCQCANGAALIQKAVGGINKDVLLDEVASFVLTGRCKPAVIELLEHFGYAYNGTICVPAYMPSNHSLIMRIEEIVEECIGAAMTDTLLELSSTIDITAIRHGVDKLEIANELYHILFGTINEELVRQGIVKKPYHFPGEGRYLKCIEVYESMSGDWI